MAGKISRCNHVTTIGSQISWEYIKLKQKYEECDTCSVAANNLWLCLVGNCNYVGCGESVKDHSSTHAEEKRHCLTINLSTLRIWCYRCEGEVYPDKNNPPFLIADKTPSQDGGTETSEELSRDSSPSHGMLGGDESESEGEEESGQNKPRGLTGLQNRGNTCYLNAALQALSNCPPLTRFFLDCPGFVHPEKSPMLSKSYLKLIKELWHKKRPSYLVPTGVVSGIKLVHPMFRGYSQQDTQEFLRCFMDQLHEELKQPVIEDPEERDHLMNIHETADTLKVTCLRQDRSVAMDTSSTSSQSDVDYETCDSALGSERGSAEHNDSSDDNSDTNEASRLNFPANKELKTRAQRMRHSLSKSEDASDSSIGNKLSKAKEQKDTINWSKRASDNISVSSEDQRSDSGEYVDAESEPLRPRRAAGNKVVGSDDKDQAKKQNYCNSAGYQPYTGRGFNKNPQFQSVISDIFDGKLNSSVQCLTCERVSTTKETFQDLSLPIPSKDHLTMLHSSTHHSSGPKGGACSEVHQGWLQLITAWLRSWFLGPVITLQDCLAAFFSADELKGDNMYSCEKCKKLRNGVKYSKVLKLPEILCIHLKRFRHEFYSSKINTYVSFPLENLDMKPYLHKDHTSDITTYDLIAVICHHGTAGGGHYTAYCQNIVTEQWYEFDDQYVTEVDFGQVLNCEAYVLFYRKQNDHMSGCRQEAVELMERREPSLMHFFVSKQWINRFNTFAEPGPITNEDFLCLHGGVPPSRVEHIEDLVQPLTQTMWEFLHDRFGGGPACNHLFPCSHCHRELEELRLRQKTELEEFIKLNEKFKEEDNPTVIYAISMSWFKEWENFVREKEDTPPGPIDNKRISLTKGGLPVVRPNSDHGQLSGEMWGFLYTIYGGGPELIIKQVAPSPQPVAKTLAEQAQAKTITDQTQNKTQTEQAQAGPVGKTERVDRDRTERIDKVERNSLQDRTEKQERNEQQDQVEDTETEKNEQNSSDCREAVEVDKTKKD